MHTQSKAALRRTADLSPLQTGARPKRLNRYWDPHLSTRTVKLQPGEHCVSSTDETLVTVVASSVAVCLRDTQKNVLGMGHFMLPTSELGLPDGPTHHAARVSGHAAMAKFLEQVYSYGCDEHSLQAVLVSGADIWPHKRQSTRDTLRLARAYLGAHQIEIVGEFFAGSHPKKVYFNLRDALPYVRVLHAYSTTVEEREDHYLRSLLTDLEPGHLRAEPQLQEGVTIF